MRQRDFKSFKVTFEVRDSLDCLKCCTRFLEGSYSSLPGLAAVLLLLANLLPALSCLPCLCFGVGSPSWPCNQSGGQRTGTEVSTDTQVPFTLSYMLRLSCLSCRLLFLSLYDIVPVIHKIVCLNHLSSYSSLKELSRHSKVCAGRLGWFKMSSFSFPCCLRFSTSSGAWLINEGTHPRNTSPLFS